MTAPSPEHARQARAYAASLDARNRPLFLVAGALGVLAIAVVYALWQISAVYAARGSLAAAEARAQSYAAQIAEIRALRASDIELTDYFPRQPFFVPQLEAVLRPTLGEPNARTPGGPVIRVQPQPARTTVTNADVRYTDVRVNTTGVAPEDLFAALDAIEMHDNLYRSVIMSFRIASTPTQWIGEFTSRMYETTP